MPTGKKRKRSVAQSTSLALIKLIKISLLLDQERDVACKIAKICTSVKHNQHDGRTVA